MMKRSIFLALLSVCFLNACARFGGEKEEGEIGFAAKIRDRAWTLEQPPTPGESPTVSFWRQRYQAWLSGSLPGYPFEPAGTPFVSKGDGISEARVDLPARSVHETEPWGDDGCVWPNLNRWSLEWEIGRAHV